jgi:hypothetical protein
MPDFTVYTSIYVAWVGLPIENWSLACPYLSAQHCIQPNSLIGSYLQLLMHHIPMTSIYLTPWTTHSEKIASVKFRECESYTS